MVTSTQDALSTAGVSAITAASGDGTAFSVTAPAPADVGAQFTPANLDAYRAVVFLDTGQASPLNDAQRRTTRPTSSKGGGFVGIGSAIETDPGWQFLTDVLGTRSSGRTDGADRRPSRSSTASTTRARACPSTGIAPTPSTTSPTNVRGVSHVLATVVEDPFGPQPQGNTLNGIAGGTMGANHPISFCKDYQGGRSFYTGARQHGRELRRRHSPRT